jgi:cell division protein FtsB
MALLREIRARARQITPPVLAACVVAYFGYHALHGERGFLAWRELRQDLAAAQTSAARLAEERARLELRVGLLRPDNLDPDLLEERANALLGYGHQDDLIILLPDRRAAPAEPCVAPLCDGARQMD